MLQQTLLLLRSPLFLMSFTALITLLLSASIFQKQQHDLIDLRNTHYGKALATLAARQATDATLNHDLVSLQVILRDVANNPHIINTTIHDVENHLLVQAGAPPSSRGFLSSHSRSYSAPITIQDSIAGHVTVTLDTEVLYEQQEDSWLIGLIGLSLALLVLSILNLRRKTDTTEPSSAIASEQPVVSNEEEISLPIRTRSNDGSIRVGLKLYCLNRTQLEQQLSSALLQQLSDQLERHLSEVNAVYNGRVIRADKQTIDLHFQGDDLEGTIFRAICATQLLFILLQPDSSGIQLKYAAAIFSLPASASLDTHYQQSHMEHDCAQLLAKQSEKSVLLENEQCGISSLLQRLQCDQQLLQEQWLSIKGLHSGYQNLIEKQAAQLGHLNRG